jgi:hypothetical protein
MKFNAHWELEGLHAFLSPSKYSWIRYDEDKLVETYRNHRQTLLGTRQHEFAKEAIEMGIKLPKIKKTLNLFVNDAIGYKMTAEVPLFYSQHCFGTADAIGFRNKKLRIHDLKTGTTKTKMDQLMVYAALFCLEYQFKPGDIDIELRIYQNNECVVFEPEVGEIYHIMLKIKQFSDILDQTED